MKMLWVVAPRETVQRAGCAAQNLEAYEPSQVPQTMTCPIKRQSNARAPNFLATPVMLGLVELLHAKIPGR